MRIFSGIRSSGDKTLGNYSGGFRQYVATQEQGDAFFCVVDLHSITTPFEPDVLHEATLSVAAWLFATGLDPNRSTVFVQSHVQAHAEAAWLLSAVTSWGELRRMTQFKDRAAEQDFVSAGLFNYPVLMAGDILLYQADVVPIGDDQRQHLELSRNIAERFNGRFGETFKVPEGVYPEEGARVKNLQEPERLMSTTRGAPAGVVRMIDPPDEVRKKFKTAVTDSGTEVRHDPEEKPGVSNLIEIMAVVTGKSISEVESQFDGEGYGTLKGGVAEAVVELLAPIQERYNALRADEGELRRMLAVGADKAREASAPTLESMYERMGFVRPDRGIRLSPPSSRSASSRRHALRGRRAGGRVRRRAAGARRPGMGDRSGDRGGGRPVRPRADGRPADDAREPAGALRRPLRPVAPARSSSPRRRSSGRSSRTRCSCSGWRSSPDRVVARDEGGVMRFARQASERHGDPAPARGRSSSSCSGCRTRSGDRASEHAVGISAVGAVCLLVVYARLALELPAQRRGGARSRGGQPRAVLVRDRDRRARRRRRAALRSSRTGSSTRSTRPSRRSGSRRRSPDS